MKKLLLVDDDESNRLTLSVLLEDEGYEVDVASSFAEASRIIAAGPRYDAVLLDQHLGDGLGLDLLGALRERLPGAKAILISGSINEHDGVAFGADAVLLKATPFPELLERLRSALGEEG
ncbi:MAG: response regulator [Polyangiaceae bacterium]|nr:response regulator [Polyangiaceae bacterium]